MLCCSTTLQSLWWLLLLRIAAIARSFVYVMLYLSYFSRSRAACNFCLILVRLSVKRILILPWTGSTYPSYTISSIFANLSKRYLWLGLCETFMFFIMQLWGPVGWISKKQISLRCGGSSLRAEQFMLEMKSEMYPLTTLLKSHSNCQICPSSATGLENSLKLMLYFDSNFLHS